jgi:hypothetical protein
MFSVFGKIKDFIIATLILAVPIIYLFGRSSGKASEKSKIFKDDLQAKEKATEFYKSMSEHEEDGTIDSRAGLADRLRGTGL